MEDEVEVEGLLTDAGGKYEQAMEQRKILALTHNNGVYELFISKSHAQEPHVLSFAGKIKRKKIQVSKKYVDMNVIADLYSQNGMTSEDDEATSAMQEAALKIFADAAKRRASDIHIIRGKDNTTIMFRIDGDLTFIGEETADHGSKLCAAIYQSMTNNSESTYKPNDSQDAQISHESQVKMPAILQGIRIGTSPITNGSLMVLRLLYGVETSDFSLEPLGFNSTQVAITSLLKRLPTGLNLVAGPTGSGKSTSIQRILSSLIVETEGRKHVLTVEDPVEYPIKGANQTSVKSAETEEESTKLFHRAIKAAMRLDPDVALIGEIRDTPSGVLAVRAAMTGHQVWATIHANSALGVLDRLIDLGVPSELVYDHTIISGLISQRLLKALCPHCKVKLSSVIGNYVEKDINRVLSVANITEICVKGDGCKHCGDSGIKGRIAAVETIKTDATLMSHFREGNKLEAKRYLYEIQRAESTLDSAIDKVEQGLVDPFIAEETVGPLVMGEIERDNQIDKTEVQRATS